MPNWQRKLSCLILSFILSLFYLAGLGHAATNVSGTISTDTAWVVSGSPYHVSNLTVASGITLTIEPGVIVKVPSGYSAITIEGTLIADGTATQPIVFTSIYDDTYGGDSNGDGSGTNPSPGDWNGIAFAGISVNSIMDYTVVKYAGYNNVGGPDQINIKTSSSSLTISNSEISNFNYSGIWCLGASPNITDNTISNGSRGIELWSGSSPTISNNLINGNSLGIYVYDSPSVYSTPTITGNTITGNATAVSLGASGISSVITGNIITANTNNVISVGGTITANATMGSHDAPYQIGNLTVPTGVTLTISPGVIVKFNHGHNDFHINGTLAADGTASQPIVFTSIYDDSYGGDSNGDGNATSPAAGDWNGITFESSAINSLLDYTVIKYSGFNNVGTSDERNIFTTSSSLIISNSEISNFNYDGIWCSGASPAITNSTISSNGTGRGFQLYNGSSPTISDNYISGNSTGIWVYSTVPASPTITGNTITGNTTALSTSSSSPVVAENNYWGSSSGPLDDSDDTLTGGLYNPGGTGDKVSDYVDYIPWLGSGGAVCNSLSGYIKDFNTGMPIPGATVTIFGIGSVSTDATGYFSFSCVGDGNYRVSISANGYTIVDSYFSLFDNLPDLNFSLTIPSTSYGPGSSSGYSNDPVNTALGNFIYNHTDLTIKGRGINFEFGRGYNSQDDYNGPLGYGWSHKYNIVLSEAGSGVVTVKFGDGHTEAFTTDGGGGYTTQPGSYKTLVKNAGPSYELAEKNGITYHFDSTPRLTSITDRNSNTITCGYDGAGDMTTITDTVGRVINFVYDAIHHITSMTDPIGRVIQYQYDGNGDLVSITDARGNSTTFTYDVNHQILTGTDPNGNIFVTNTYDAADRVVTVQQDALGNSTTFSYNETTKTTTLTDALGNVTIHKHDDTNRLIKLTDPLGHSVSYTYDTDGNRTTVNDKNSHVTTYTYDATGNVLTKNDALGNTTTITYDSLNNPLTRTDALGNIATFAYDGNGNLLSETNSLGNTTSHTYDASGSRLSTTDANGNTTNFGYDFHANIITVTDVNWGVTAYGYDGVSRKISKTDPLGNTTTYTYDKNDNRLTVTDPLGNTTTSAYDGNDNLVSVKNALGNTTTSTYDAKDRLVSITDPLAGVTSYTYDALDRKTSQADPNGNVTSFNYNAAGRLVSQANALSQTTCFFYDAEGNRTKIMDSMGRLTLFAYDAVNQLISTTDALGYSSQQTYDAVGRVLSKTDADGKTTSFIYDAIGNLIQVTDAASSTVSYTYDPVGSRLNMTDTMGRITSYTYDALNRLLSETSPLGHAIAYTYDMNGNVLTRTDADSNTTSYAYDANGQLINTTYSDLSTVAYTYDAVGNRLTMTDWVGTTTYTYDSLNRLSTVTDPYAKVITYGYDSIGNMTSITYPHTGVVSYTYDSLNRMVTITDWTGDITTYTYDTVGNLQDTEYGNNTQVQRYFDQDNRLKKLYNRKSNYSAISGCSLTLDNVGNRIGEDCAEGIGVPIGASTTSYAYDDDDRINSASTDSYTFNNSGKMLTEVSAATTTYTYNAQGRLSGITDGVNTWQFIYNGDGHRLQKTENAQVSLYVVDPSGSLTRVLVETDNAGVTLASYVYGKGLVSRVASDDSHHYYHFDHRGAAKALTDDSGTVTDTYSYSVFGILEDSVGASENPYRFLGQYGVTDDNSGLLYIRARYYNPDLGRFITKDTYTGEDTNSQSLNRFVYALNNPTLMVDISGYSASYASSDKVHQGLISNERLRLLMRLYDDIALSKEMEAYYNAEVNILEALNGSLQALQGLYTGSGVSISSGLLKMGGALTNSLEMNGKFHSAANFISSGLEIIDLASSAHNWSKALDGRTAQSLALNLDINANLPNSTTKTFKAIKSLSFSFMGLNKRLLSDNFGW